ncbi:c-type cytochrome [Roseomonas marmotae]|uniref:C-type cytochrome n=1 Tax=Roseomonas marmotae TaxID=2768161 RepID=A0ABS3KI84_9PROT|nr:c-type cytochrome [Roseomonas marmotae]MBO1076712.1 c-type cytochrome [Roseomonas marmotae]QTI79828.1 c-type cytochrome [Roseomonas marmotae]
MLIRVTWRRAALTLAVLILGGLLFAWSGLFNVAASGGHWAVTNWFLHWVMRSSVRTHSLLVEPPPPLHDVALKARAAGHYASGCAPCHGAPGEPQNPVVRRSTPTPPQFPAELGEWRPRELFRIVQHGVRYTGMPAWIVPERHDEIWAMVAFLEALPVMPPEEYRRLAHGEQAEARPRGGSAGLDGLSNPSAQALADCTRCHGSDGLGRDGDAFPVIAGQSEAYLLQALRAYADGTRHSGIMQAAAARAGGEALQALAAHYAAQPRHAVPQSFGPALLAEGETIARQGLPDSQVPACLSCHGSAALARNPAWPRLEGQHAGYLEGQLAQWRDGTRGGGPFRKVMRTIAQRLTPGQARAVSAWFAAQGEAGQGR